MNGVKETKTVVGAIQVVQNTRHMCLTEGVCLVARVSTGPAVQQIRVGALSPMPSCLGIGRHPRGSRQGHPQYTGALKSMKAVGGPFGSDSRYTANKFKT